MDWLQHHLIGWEFFFPAIIVASAASIRLVRADRAHLLPWGVVLPWVATVVACYLDFGMDRFWYYARARWVAMTVTLLIASSPPFLAVAGVALGRWSRTLERRHAILVGIALGTAMIPVTNLVSGLLGSLLLPLLPPR